MKNYKVTLHQRPDTDRFIAKNQDGYALDVNGLSAEDAGKGISPMEMMLTAAGGCASIDIICLLKKDGVKVQDLTVEVNGSRNMRETPAYFRKVHLNFNVKADITPERLEKIIKLSLEKYCTVGRTLEHFSDMFWSYSLNGESSQEVLLQVNPETDSNALLVRAKDNSDSSV